jgi:imidazole glycerol-phosphate synthase subunit HisH
LIAVIDYGMGNLRSVAKALEAIGEEPQVTARAEDLRVASHLVLPGVGAFGQCAANLRATGLIDVLEEEVRGRGKPFLGICVGMQLLAERSEEDRDSSGLGWLAGAVRRFPTDGDRKVPHMGWNDVSAAAETTMFRGIRQPVFYFVHSYYLDLADAGVVSATCEYGRSFAAAVAVDNLWAVQFHPEKSQQNGLRFLQNFVAHA